MQTSETIAELAKALAAAQAQMSHASKDRTNPAFKSRYADLASIIDACRDALAANHIAVLQSPETNHADGQVSVSVQTRLVHASGEWAQCIVSTVCADGRAQTIGSAITYLRRYGLASLAGVAPDDDDGQAASSPPPRREPPPPAATLDDVVRAVEHMTSRWPDQQARIIATGDGDGPPEDKLARLRALHIELRGAK